MGGKVILGMESEIEIGNLIGGRWRLNAFVGQGAFGQVFKAEDESTVGLGSAAVKVLHPNTSPQERNEFLNEVKKIAAMRHSNLVAYMDSGIHTTPDGTPRTYLVTEFAENSLDKYVEAQPGGRLSLADADAVLSDIAAGLAHLHRRNLVHRDLKPANVLLSDGEWKLADFGLARDLTATGHYHHGDLVRGTPKYMAPELFEVDKASAKVDVYSVGVLMQRILAGQFLHEGTNDVAFIVNVTTKPRALSPNLPADWHSFVDITTRRNPDERPDAGQLVETLARIRDNRGPVTPDPNANTVITSASPPTVVTPSGQVPSPVPAPTAAVAQPSAGFTSPPVPQAQPSTGVPPTQVGVAPPAAGGDSKKTLAFAAAALVAILAAAGLVGFLASRGGDDPVPTTEVTTGTDDGGTAPAPGPAPEPDPGPAPVPPPAPPVETSTPIPEISVEPLVGPARIGITVGPPGLAFADCVNFEGDSDIKEFFIVDCNDPHRVEIAGFVAHPEAAQVYPGDGELFAYANPRCVEEASKYANVDDIYYTTLFAGALVPDQGDWNGGLFNSACYISGLFGQDLVGWVQGNGQGFPRQDSVLLAALAVGDCFNTPDGDGGEDIDAITAVDIVDCSTPHNGEFVGRGWLGYGNDEPFLGDDRVLDESKAICAELFTDRYGQDADGFSWWWWSPFEESWDRGVREVHCAIVDDIEFTGAVNYNSVVRFNELETGQCFDLTINRRPDQAVGNEPVMPLDCGSPHHGEFFGRTTVADDLAGSDEIQEAARVACNIEFESYVGRAFEDSVLSNRYWFPSEVGYSDGDREVFCAFLNEERTSGSLFESDQ